MPSHSWGNPIYVIGSFAVLDFITIFLANWFYVTRITNFFDKCYFDKINVC